MRSSDQPNLSARSNAAKSQAIDALLQERTRRVARGETIPDRQLIDDHPELAPELAQALTAAKEIRRAVAQARLAGPAETPLTVLSADELTAPLSVGDDEAPSACAPEPRPAIDGYTIEAEIGSGGQAVVYRARQDSTGQRVAIKVLPGGPFISSRRRERFDRETAILASIQHPHIVSIIDRGRTADGSFFFVMPFVAGTALDEYVARRRSEGTEPATILRLLRKVAEAVGEAHRLEVVHRDLKPSNVRIDERGDPYILDFGLARPRTELAADDWRARTVTSEGQIVGSLPWASPEQAAGERGVDIRSDVYSLGVMLYEALTGVFPYSVSGPVREVLDRIAHAEPPLPSHHAAGKTALNEAADTIVLKCLAKRPIDRYASARELADDLDRLLSGSTITAQRITPAGKPRRWSRRRRWFLALGVIVVLLSGVAGWRWWSGPATVHVVELPALTNSVGMRLIRVPAGQFLMGSPKNEDGRIEGEHQRMVLFDRPFYVAATEVTRGQYRAVMGHYPKDLGTETASSDQLPATGISWYNAVEFCARLSSREPGRKYRLPTEAEWEFACRAGSKGPFSGTGRLDEMGWFSGNSGGRLHPVAQKQPNQWGLYDLHGNASEWCSDTSTPLTSDTRTAEAGNQLILGRVVRGGGATSAESNCRAAHRGIQMQGGASEFTTFRPVLENIADLPQPRPISR